MSLKSKDTWHSQDPCILQGHILIEVTLNTMKRQQLLCQCVGKDVCMCKHICVISCVPADPEGSISWTIRAQNVPIHNVVSLMDPQDSSLCPLQWLSQLFFFLIHFCLLTIIFMDEKSMANITPRVLKPRMLY